MRVVADPEDFFDGLEAARRENGEADPTTTATRARLARFYLAHDRMDEARAVVKAQMSALRGAAEASDDPEVKMTFAVEALSCEPVDLQDPESALAFALEAAELGAWQNPDVLDTLAAAYHRTGDAARAVEVAGRALDLIPKDDTARREPLEAALTEYREARAGGS
jgi:hypothetical protein